MTYFKLLFKNLRLKASLWILILCGLSVSIPPVFDGLYKTSAEREAMKMTVDNPAMVALIGPIPAGDYTTAVMFSHQMLIFMALFHGLCGILIANSIARKDEESGLIEYTFSSGISKNKIVTSQIMIGIVMNALIFILLFGGLSLYNFDSFTMSGNIYYALGLSLIGLFFFVLTLVLGNVFESADMTFGVSLTLLLGFYLYRAATDVYDTTYSVISPYHWLSRAEIYGSNDWMWLLPFASIVVFIVLAYVLFAKRDIGDSYIKLGKEKKTRTIKSYPKLSYLNMRVLMVSWLIGLFLVGISYGSIFGDLNAVIGDNDMLQQALSGNVVAEFIGLLFVISALIAAIPSLMINGRILTEEKQGRLEMMISGTKNSKISRTIVFGTHYIYGIVIGVLSLFLTAFGMYIASINVDELNITLADYMLAVVNYSAAIVFIIGVSLLLIGLSKKLHIIAWMYVGYVFFTNYFGMLMNIDELYLMLSPFYYLNNLPEESVSIVNVLSVGGAGVLLAFIGGCLFNRRNLL